jgi:hypothetical protein
MTLEPTAAEADLVPGAGRMRSAAVNPLSLSHGWTSESVTLFPCSLVS